MRFVDLIAEKLNLLLRIIYTVILMLIIGTVVWQYLTNERSLGMYFTTVSFASILLILPLFIFPHLVELLSVVSFMFSVYLLTEYPFFEKPAAVLLYALASAILFSRGYYHKFRTGKIILTVAVFAGMFTMQLRFGNTVFLKSLVTLLWHMAITFLILLFYYLYLRNHGKARIEKILDLTQFTELTARDKEWLRLVQKETKYDTIAATWNVTTGTVKNRMRIIFDIIGVSDRIGFMAVYGGFELVG